MVSHLILGAVAVDGGRGELLHHELVLEHVRCGHRDRDTEQDEDDGDEDD
eukprot:COSAG05_NODE_7343_length_824_cov_1.406897_2_plen_49_part_01